MLIYVVVMIVSWLVVVIYSKERSNSWVRRVGLGAGMVYFLVKYDGLEVCMSNFCKVDIEIYSVMNGRWRFGYDGISIYFIIVYTRLVVTGILSGLESIYY